MFALPKLKRRIFSLSDLQIQTFPHFNVTKSSTPETYVFGDGIEKILNSEDEEMTNVPSTVYLREKVCDEESYRRAIVHYETDRKTL